MSLLFGYHMPNYTFPGVSEEGLFDHVVELARAEAAGFHLVTVIDHFYQIPGVGPEDNAMLESYSTLAALAPSTSRVSRIARLRHLDLAARPCPSLRFEIPYVQPVSAGSETFDDQFTVATFSSLLGGRLVFKKWCARQESNLLPCGPEPHALSGELRARSGPPSVVGDLTASSRGGPPRSVSGREERVGWIMHIFFDSLTGILRACSSPDRAHACGVYDPTTLDHLPPQRRSLAAF
jgi:hypothetical protein